MTDAQKLQQTFEQVSAIFAQSGIEPDETVMRYLQPLLDGEMTLEEHEQLLRGVLEKISHD